MTRHFLRLAIAATLIGLAAAVPVRAGDGCRPYPTDAAYAPTQVKGCVLYGRGIASHWNGVGVARNDCLWPWTDCTPITITSLETGRSITVTPRMWGDLYVTTPQQRLVDLDRAAVDALGLRWADGLYEVVVTPAVGMPDTSL